MPCCAQNAPGSVISDVIVNLENHLPPGVLCPSHQNRTCRNLDCTLIRIKLLQGPALHQSTSQVLKAPAEDVDQQALTRVGLGPTLDC